MDITGATREERLEKAQRAIKEGKAYVESAWGPMKVLAYNDKTGWVVVDNGPSPFGQRRFMTTLEDIKTITTTTNQGEAPCKSA